jgi:hypothetical protein
VRETVVAHASLSTQRHLVTFLQSKGKGKGSKGTKDNSDGGKGKAPSSSPRTYAEAVSQHPEAASSSRAAQPDSTPPWHTSTPQTSAAEDASDYMHDQNGPERGAKRFAPTDTSAPQEATENQDREDEFQEAARYRRGDGHLI